jgi:hypothetical protein
MRNKGQRGPQDERSAPTRAADTDRIQVAQLLTDAAAQGRLQTYAELDSLRSDLIGSSVGSPGSGAGKPAPSMLLLAIMSAFERRGRWNVPKKLTTFALWGGGVIDLRYADFTSTEVEIRACSIMGGQTILLPPEVNVEIKGHGVMGGFDHDVAGKGTPGAPTVKIRGFSLWGGVGVKRKNRKTEP